MPKIGKGTKVEICLLPLGSRVKPVDATLIVAATAQAKDTSSPAEITLVSALGAGVVIAPGNHLSFVAPTTGKIVTVRVIAEAKAGDTTIDVDIIPEEIAASSVAAFPMVLRERTAANLGRSGNRISAVDFDSSGYADGQTTSIEQTIEIPGNWSPLDAGFATAEYGFTELFEQEFWLRLTLPKISSAYTKGRIYEGPASITALPLEIPADGIITGNISAAFNGKPFIIADTPTA